MIILKDMQKYNFNYINYNKQIQLKNYYYIKVKIKKNIIFK